MVVVVVIQVMTSLELEKPLKSLSRIKLQSTITVRLLYLIYGMEATE